jgi:hypothetical protein
VSFGPILGKPKQRTFSTYDLEWTPAHSPERSRAIGLDPLQVRVVGCFDGERYRPYKNIKDFLRGELTPKNSGRWYYAHAGGLYDVQFVLEHILKFCPDYYEVSAALSSSSAIIVRVEAGRHHWTFVDSFWLMRTSLRKIGDWVGMKKGGAEGKTDTFWAPLPELTAYNEQDCRILWFAIAQLEAVILSLGGQLEKTAASTAMSLFRRAYLKREIETSDAVNEIARETYIASRVEPFAREGTNLSSYDINSSFPYAMTFPVPGNLTRESLTRPRDKHALYLAQVDVHMPESHVPVLPVRGKQDGRIYFPTGRWRAWYCSTDLDFLEEAGGEVERTHRVLEFEPFDDMAEYASDLYERRVSSTDDGYKQVLKIMLNSLYGKTAEAGRKSRLFINPPSHILSLPDYKPGLTGKRFIRPGVWEVVEEKEVPHAHVPIATQITAFARRTLGRYLREAPRVYYCDTDSVFVDDTFSWPESSELGGLKLEKKMAKAHFMGPKLYAWQSEGDAEWGVKAKGFSKVATPGGENRNFAGIDYWALSRGESVELSRFSRVRELCSSMLPEPRETTASKRLRGNLRPKRCFRSDGTSRAWSIDELDQDWAGTSEQTPNDP